MAKKSDSPTCCLTLPLLTEKWQADRLEKRFEIARQIYNTLLGAELKKYRKLESSPEYQEIQQQLAEIYKNNGDTKLRKSLLEQRRKMLRAENFDEYGFKDDMKDYYKHFSDNIGSSVAVHGIATQVWTAFEKFLYGNGKMVHFKRRGDMHSVRGYSVSNKSGGSEIMYKGSYIEWKGLKIRLKIDKNNPYETEMLENRVKYVRIVKENGRNKAHWYAQLVLEGIPARKRNKQTGEVVHKIGCGTVGIDIGPQTIAYSSQSEVNLIELADRVQNIENAKRKYQRKMDRSRRATNPDNYAPDGTIKRGVKLTRNKSKRYIKMQKELAYLQHRQAAIRKLQHNILANYLLTLGDSFIVEKMEWASLAKKAKETSISEKTGRYKRKKRFGKSLANKAPAMFISILNQKCISLGLQNVVEVDTKVRASQYNHITDDYQKKSLSQRWNTMPDGRKIQRDIYSAFLLQHINEERNGFDREALIQDYDNFIELHDHTIIQLSHQAKTLSSMGIRRSCN